MQTADDLGQVDKEVRLPEGPKTGQRYDIFGTANFFNYKPWAASIEYLLDQDIDRIVAHDQTLVSHLIDNLDESKFQLISPSKGQARSTLVYISCRDQSRNQEIYQTLGENRIGLAFRRGLLRFSPHLYNTVEDIDRVLTLLHSL
jgi:selenocysteine lyase/cysteine desulfurase